MGDPLDGYATQVAPPTPPPAPNLNDLGALQVAPPTTTPAQMAKPAVKTATAAAAPPPGNKGGAGGSWGPEETTIGPAQEADRTELKQLKPGEKPRAGYDPLGGIREGIDKITEGIEAYNQQGRAEHPVLSRLGDVTREVKELLEGGQAAGKPLGTTSGLETNPVVQAIALAPEAAEWGEAAEGRVRAIPEYFKPKVSPKIAEAFDDAGAVEVAPPTKSVVDTTIAPHDFLKAVGANDGGAMSSEQVELYRDMIRKGSDIQPPVIEYDENGNIVGGDGRHRAMAYALENTERMPVRVHRQLAPEVAEEPRYDLGELQPLRATQNRATNPAAESAQRFNEARNRPEIDHEAPPLDEERAKALAAEMDAHEHEPNNPEVREAYTSLIQDVKDQWRHAVDDLGIHFEPSEKDPYDSYEAVRDDVKNNNRLKIFTGGNELPADHPLAATDPETGLTYNTMLRGVHDLFGHIAGDNDFSEGGEAGATHAHRQMMSEPSVPALLNETEGQVSQFFHGKNKGEFPPQNATVVPRDLVESGAPDWTKKATAAMDKSPAGGINPRTGQTKFTGVGSEIVPEAREARERLDHRPTQEDVRSFRDEHKDLFDKHPELNVGWDKTDQGWELNIGAVGTREGAVKVGSKLDQRAVWDIDKGEEIPTGGKGERTSFPEYPIEERLRDLKSESAAPEERYVHYSSEPIEGGVISGERRGEALAGSESARLQHENKVPGVYAYREGSEAESQIRSRANKNTIVGNKNIADISGAQKEEFEAAHKEAFDRYKAEGDNDTMASQKALNDAEAHLRDAGYQGYEHVQGRPGTVFLFGDHPIEGVEGFKPSENRAPSMATDVIKNLYRNAPDYVAPVAGKPLEIPADVLTDDATTESTLHHEAAHAVLGSLRGADAYQIISHLHPDAAAEGFAAAADFDYRDWGGDASGNISHEAATERINDMMDMMAAGGVSDEHFHGIPWGENQGIRGDVRMMEKLMAAADVPEDDREAMIQAARDRATEVLTKPGVREIIQKHMNNRPEGLDESLHMDDEGIRAMTDEIKEHLNGNNTEDSRIHGSDNQENDARTEGQGEGESVQEVGKEVKLPDSRENAIDTDIPLTKLSVSPNAYSGASSDINRGRESRTEGPISVIRNPDNGQYLVEDGMHRLVEAHQRGDETIPAKLWEGYSDTASVHGEKMDMSPLEKEEDEPLRAEQKRKVAPEEETWYHGTSAEKAAKIREAGEIRTGQPSAYHIDIPRKDSVYITKHPEVSEFYAGSEGESLPVNGVDKSKLVPDEDDVYDILRGDIKSPNSQKIQQTWLSRENAEAKANDLPIFKDFKSAWKAYTDNLEEADETSLSTDMKDFADHLKEKNPKLASAIIDETGKAAHIGSLSVQKPLEVAPGETISTRVPTAKKAVEDSMTHGLVIDSKAIYDNPELAKKMANEVRNYPGLKVPEGASDTQVLDAFKEHLKDNIKYVYDQTTPEEREAHGGWYEGANKFAADRAAEHDLTTAQGAGVLASMSPQKDWDMNASLAKRTMDIWDNKQSTKTTPEMMARGKQLASVKNAEGKYTNAAVRALLPKIEGKKLKDLNPDLQALWIRMYDEAHNPREFNKINPDGSEGPLRTTMDGEPERVAWGSLNEIGKSVKILKDGSRDNISKSLGFSHKIRNFFNNIIEPNSPRQDLTADTHAVAAAQLRPLSGNSPEVKKNFGGIMHAMSGTKGTYALYADAYREAAKDLDIPYARSLQSIVWEKIRSEFPADIKSKENLGGIDSIWKEYTDGQISKREAQDAIFEAARGYRDQAFGGGGGASDQGKLFEPGVSGESAPGNGGGRGGNSTSGSLGKRGGVSKGAIDALSFINMMKSQKGASRTGAALMGAGIAGAGAVAALSGGNKEEEPQAPQPRPEARTVATEAPTDVHGLIKKASNDYGVPEAILHAQANQESKFNQDAVSRKGARGVMQLMPNTARSLNVDANDMAQNVDGGARLMSQLHHRFGSYDKALAAYNWSPDKVQDAIDTYGNDWLKHTPAETRNYVLRIMKNSR